MRSFITGLSFLLALVSFSISASSLSSVNASEVVAASDKAMRGNSSYSEATMEIIRPEWKRSMSMKSWTKGTELSLVLVTAPAKDKGSASLKRDREMWNWVPSIERVIKIAPSMLSQSWMGSDFTNDDLINQSSIVVDYQHKLIRDDTFDDDPVWVIDAIAKPEAPVVWSRVTLWISKETHLQRKVEFFDEFEDLVNVLETFDIKEMGGRMLPTKMEMSPVDKPGHKTVFSTHSAQFNFDIDSDFFSISQMKSLRE